MGSITKLSKKLDIRLPEGTPNGAALLCTTDPYLKEATSWGSLTKEAGSYGIQYAAGNVSARALRQAATQLANKKLKMYFEVESNWHGSIHANGVYQVWPGSGIYVVEYDATGTANIDFYLTSCYVTPDPSFKNVAVGPLPVNTSVTSGWCSRSVPSTAKRSDGRIALTRVNSPSTYGTLFCETAIPNLEYVETTIVVDYLPPGGDIQLEEYAGAILLLITQPGRYTVRHQYKTAQPIELNNRASVDGSAVVSYFQTKAASIAINPPDLLFLKVTCLFAAEATLFDAILDPQEYVFINQLDKGPQQNNIIGYNDKAPVAGYYRQGDIVRNNALVSGTPIAWKCFQAGNPGLWAELPRLP